MKVILTRENEKVYFRGEDDSNIIHIDGSSEIGGENKGFRPMQILLYAIGSCAVFDFVSMLYKQRRAFEDIIV